MVVANELQETKKEPAYDLFVLSAESNVNPTNELVGNHASGTVTPLYVPSPECACGQANSYINSLYAGNKTDTTYKIANTCPESRKSPQWCKSTNGAFPPFVTW
jgi:hypothetical protein